MSRADVELLGPVTVRAIVNEMAPVELARILASEQDAAPRSGDEAEAALEEFERDLQRLVAGQPERSAGLRGTPRPAPAGGTLSVDRGLARDGDRRAFG